MRAWIRRDQRWRGMLAVAAAWAGGGLSVCAHAQPDAEPVAAAHEAEATHDDEASEPAGPAAADVARELFRLQQARGGSIVPDWSELQESPSPQEAPRPEWSPHRPVTAEAAPGNQPIFLPPPSPVGPPREGRSNERPAPLHASAPLPAPPGAYGLPGAPSYAPPPAATYGPPGMPRPLLAERPGPSRIEALRGAAAQLDQAASRLEGLDLYEQADRLRETAQQLRLAAREMRERQMHEMREREMREREMHEMREREMREREMHEMREREMREREMRERG